MLSAPRVPIEVCCGGRRSVVGSKVVMHASAAANGEQFLEVQHGHQVAFQHVVGKKEGQSGVLYLNGLLSTLNGSKARTILEWASSHGHEAAVFDYRGHGSSTGMFSQLGPQDWLQDALAVLDNVMTAKQVVLVGSSIGGWLAVHVALLRPQRVQGLLLIAPAFDCSACHWASLTDEERRAAIQHGHTPFKSPYFPGPDPPLLGLEFFRQGASLSLLDSDKHYQLLKLCEQLQGSSADVLHAQQPPILLDLACQIMVMHGDADDVTPLTNSVQFIAKVEDGRGGKAGGQCHLHVVTQGDHRLSLPKNLELMCQLMSQLMKYECADVPDQGHMP